MTDFLRSLSLNTARVVFVGALVLSLVVGLEWALDPDARPEVQETVASLTPADGQRGTPATAPAQTGASPTPPADAPEVLIAAAGPPGDTTVQVLEAGGGSARVDRAVAAVEQLGYDLVAINDVDETVQRTTIAYTEGGQAQARGLRARDPRFQEIRANDEYSEEVDMHILVGPDF